MKTKQSTKGTISVSMLITIFLLIVGFVLLLMFYYSIDWSKDIDKQTCHESVIFRATASQISSMAGEYIPLKCKTTKYCITNKLIGSGDCSKDFGNVKGITTVKARTVTEIEKFYAENLLRCWEMMGEGKVSLFTKPSVNYFGISGAYSSCIICSRIAFDKDFPQSLLDEMNLRAYMSTHNIPGKNYTYAHYMSGDINILTIGENLKGEYDIDKAIKEIESKRSVWHSFVNWIKGEKLQDEISIPTDLPQDPASMKKENAILFMQIYTPGGGEVLKNTVDALGIGAATSFVLAPRTTFRFAKAAIVGWKIALPVAIIALLYQQGNVAYNRAIAAGYCGDLSIGNAGYGCSSVKTVDYDVDGISQYCENIESIT